MPSNCSTSELHHNTILYSCQEQLLHRDKYYVSISVLIKKDTVSNSGLTGRVGSGVKAAVVSQKVAKWMAVGQAVQLWHKPEVLML